MDSESSAAEERAAWLHAHNSAHQRCSQCRSASTWPGRWGAAKHTCQPGLAEDACLIIWVQLHHAAGPGRALVHGGATANLQCGPSFCQSLPPATHGVLRTTLPGCHLAQVLANPPLAALSGSAAPPQWSIPPPASRAALGAGSQPPSTAHATQQTPPGKPATFLWFKTARARCAMRVRWPQLPEQDAHAAKKGEPRGSLMVLALPHVEHRLCVPAGLSACMQLGSGQHLPLPASSGCRQPLGHCPQSSPVPIPLGGDKQVSGGLLTCPRIP